jgi:UDP-N-acetylmuramyl tripeptide synthase
VKIQTIQALRGPNYWSQHNTRLIQVRLELNEQRHIPDELFLHFQDVLKRNLPENFQFNKLGEHPIAFLFCAIALALQNSEFNQLSYYTFKATQTPGVFNVLFAYKNECAGKQAAKSAAALIESLQNGLTPNFNAEKTRINDLFELERNSKELDNLIDQANKRNIPFLPAEDDFLPQFGYGKNSVDIELDKLPESINSIFPIESTGRIPIIAVSGSNGKTTSTRLTAHILKTAGYSVGYTTSDGIYINGELLDEGDTTGPSSAQIVLRNKDIDVAVLETARGGIVRAGLGFDQCDLALLTNVQGDHLGISDIDTIEELNQVKAVITKALKHNGIAILNADNENTIAIGEKTDNKVAWFSLYPKNPLILAGINKGIPVAYLENQCIILQTGSTKINLASVIDIPITFNGSLKFMIQNAMGAVLNAYLFGVKAETIIASLKTFFPSQEQTPGRMNLFEVKGKTVLIDFAHNPDGFEGVRDYLATFNSPYKIGIIVGTGDRLESDLIRNGELAAEMFDHIIIQQVKFLRSRTAESIIDKLCQGILNVKPDAKWEIIAGEKEALHYALSIAPKGSIITALSNVLNQPFDLIKLYQNE